MQSTEDKDGIDFVNPIFMWLSPIEIKIEEASRAGKTSKNIAGSNAGGSRPLSVVAPSSFLKAKSAIKRTFSGGNDTEFTLRRVRQAQDACIWLKSAGFPQYVQKFEGGEFPINVTALCVEKDHKFLDSASIEALIKRLNVLNRCADLLEEVLNKNDDSDEEDMRALSEQWQFQKKIKRWSRKTINKSEFSPDSSQSTSDSSTVTLPVMVNELSTSPTLRGQVKTYTFCGDKDNSCELTVNVTSDGTDQSDVMTGADLSPQSCSTPVNISTARDTIVITPDEDEDQLECIGSFASGFLNEFDSNLLKLRRHNTLSRSLPNVLSISSNDLSSNPDEANRTCLSSLTGSPCSSVGELDKMEDYNRSESPLLASDTCCLPHSTIDTRWLNSDSSPSGLSTDTRRKKINRKNTAAMVIGNNRDPLFEKMEVNQRKRLSSSPLSARAKWHSFQRQQSFRQVFKPLRTMIPIEELSVGQITVLRKLSLVKLTALIELHNGKANLSRILKSKKRKQFFPRTNITFGAPLSNNVINYGQALPPIILRAMDHLKATGMSSVGLFRRTAAKARIEYLKELIENTPELVNFSDFTSYEIADIVKLYFREIPDSLINSKLSEALLVSYECVPKDLHLQAQRAVMLLLADENREALQCLLYFLAFVAKHSSVHQMDAQNLGVCLSPTLFSLSSVSSPSHPSLRRGSSFRKPASINHQAISPSPIMMMSPGNKELNEHFNSSGCLSELIQFHDQLFQIATDMMHLCRFSHLELGDPVPFQELGMDKNGCGDYLSYIEDCMTILAKEQKKKYRGWTHTEPLKGVSLSYYKIDDGVPLRLWRGTVEIPVAPGVVLKRLWDERFLWDGHIVKGRLIKSIDFNTEIFQYVTPSMNPLSNRDHCVLRSWRYDPINENYVIISTSVSHPNATLLADIRCSELAMRYIIEPTDNGSTNLTIFCRVDLKGRSAEYYNKSYCCYLASSIHKLRNTLKRPIDPEYAETPV